jgi:hypothetical protein
MGLEILIPLSVSRIRAACFFWVLRPKQQAMPIATTVNASTANITMKMGGMFMANRRYGFLM